MNQIKSSNIDKKGAKVWLFFFFFFLRALVVSSVLWRKGQVWRRTPPIRDVLFSSVSQSCPTLCDYMDYSNQASLSITNSWSLLRLVSIESVRPSNHLIVCHPLLLLPSVFDRIRVFSSESVLHIRWTKYWSLSLSISPSDEYSGLISFRIDWFDLLVVQGTLIKSFLIPQFKSINSLVLSLLYGPTLTSIHDYWKNHSFD